MLCTALNFMTYLPEFDPDSYRMGSTMLFFRNNTTDPLFLYRVKMPSNHKRDRFR